MKPNNHSPIMPPPSGLVSKLPSKGRGFDTFPSPNGGIISNVDKLRRENIDLLAKAHNEIVISKNLNFLMKTKYGI